MVIVILPMLVFGTVFFVYLALNWRNDTTVDSQLRAYGYDIGHHDLSAPFAERVITPLVGRIGNLVQTVSPFAVQKDLHERLQRAGHVGLDASSFLTIKVLAVAAAAFVALALPLLGGSLTIKGAIIGLVMSVLGWKVPDFWLSTRIDQRGATIQRALPDALDLIVVCVEAGNGLESAMSNVARKLTGPLAEEIERTLQEVSLGKSRREALRDLAKRTQVPDLQAFIAALLQADQLGVSIGQVLRVQADSMRVRRRQRAEEQAAKAPVKMLIPLVLLIFPALMIVVLGPAGLKIAAFFQSMR